MTKHQKEIARLCGEVARYKSCYEDTARENSELREALSFYANEDNYDEGREGDAKVAEVIYDSGEKARNALKYPDATTATTGK